MGEFDADVIVVGGGVVGLWTLHNLLSQGVKAILFEQFPYPHTRGSSHGQSRIIRTAYEKEEYSALMPECFRKWKKLEKDTGKTLLIDLPLVSAYDLDKKRDKYEIMLRNMDRYQPDYDIIPGSELSDRIPGLKSRPNWSAIVDNRGGLLKADSCLEALRYWCIGHGGVIHEAEGVLSIQPLNSTEVKVHTEKKVYKSKSIILTCGTFINGLLATVDMKIPIQTIKASVYYWKDLAPPVHSYSSKFPAVVVYEDFSHLYSLPAYEYPGYVKICYHGLAEVVDPFMRDQKSPELERDEATMFEWLKENMEKVYTDIDTSTPAIHEVCLYARSPDEKFILDFHPIFKNIVIGAGFSGHGFKTSPAVGHILANLALGIQSPYPIAPFSLDRFASRSKL